MRQHFWSVGREQYVILDPHAELVRQIDARLADHDHAGYVLHLDIRAKERRFVDLQTEAVPQAVVEEIAEALLGDVAAGDGVDVLARHARAHGGDRARLSFLDDGVDLAHFIGRLSSAWEVYI